MKVKEMAKEKWYGLYEDDILIAAVKKERCFTNDYFKRNGYMDRDPSKSYKICRIEIRKIESNVAMIQLEGTPENLESQRQEQVQINIADMFTQMDHQLGELGEFVQPIGQTNQEDVTTEQRTRAEERTRQTAENMLNALGQIQTEHQAIESRTRPISMRERIEATNNRNLRNERINDTNSRNDDNLPF